MALQINYNTIIDYFSAYTANNQQLKRYGNGSLKDLESEISKSREFPLMWSNLDHIDYPSDNAKNFVFNILFMDVLNPEKDNEQDVWNDAILQAEDLIKWLNWNAQDNYQVLPQPTINTFTERFGDYVAGCNLKITIQVDADLWNNCSIPVTNFSFNPTQINIQ